MTKLPDEVLEAMARALCAKSHIGMSVELQDAELSAWIEDVNAALQALAEHGYVVMSVAALARVMWMQQYDPSGHEWAADQWRENAAARAVWIAKAEGYITAAQEQSE